MKRTRLVFFILASITGLLGLGIFLLPSYRFTGILLLLGAGVLGLYGVLLGFLNRKGVKIFLWVFTILLALCLLLLLCTEIQILRAAYPGEPEDCAFLIVLGAGVRGQEPSLILSCRIQAAYDYLVAHPETICIASGGQGSDEDISEARCIADNLMAMGIPEDRILLEEASTSTSENFRFSIQQIREATGTEPEKVAVVSSEFHLYRACAMARNLGLDPVGVPAETPWPVLRLNYFLREAFGVWYYYLSGG